MGERGIGMWTDREEMERENGRKSKNSQEEGPRVLPPDQITLAKLNPSH